MSDIWAIRGVPEELRAAIVKRAAERRETVGELVGRVLQAALDTQPVDELAELRERVAALEAAAALRTAHGRLRKPQDERFGPAARERAKALVRAGNSYQAIAAELGVSPAWINKVMTREKQMTANGAADTLGRVRAALLPPRS